LQIRRCGTLLNEAFAFADDGGRAPIPLLHVSGRASRWVSLSRDPTPYFGGRRRLGFAGARWLRGGGNEVDAVAAVCLLAAMSVGRCVFWRPPHFHAVSVFKPSSAMWRRASTLQPRGWPNSTGLQVGTPLRSWGNSSGEGMMRGNSGDRCPPPGSLTFPSPSSHTSRVIKVFSADEPLRLRLSDLCSGAVPLCRFYASPGVSIY